MKLPELEAMFERLSNDMAFCSDDEYIHIVHMRRAIWEYMEATKDAGDKDFVPRKGYTGSGKIDVC